MMRGYKLLSFTSSKSRFPLVLNLVTLIDLNRLNGRYFVLSFRNM